MCFRTCGESEASILILIDYLQFTDQVTQVLSPIASSSIVLFQGISSRRKESEGLQCSTQSLPVCTHPTPVPLSDMQSLLAQSVQLIML